MCYDITIEIDNDERGVIRDFTISDIRITKAEPEIF